MRTITNRLGELQGYSLGDYFLLKNYYEHNTKKKFLWIISGNTYNHYSKEMIRKLKIETVSDLEEGKKRLTELN